MSRFIYSLDVETTGLDPLTCQVLEIAIIAWDLDGLKPLSVLPRFHCYVDNGEILHGNPYAFSMHPDILRRIANQEPGFQYLTPDQAVKKIHEFAAVLNGVDDEGRVKMQFAGKNFGAFDYQFMNRLPFWAKLIRAKHRSYDPAAYFFKCLEDAELPSMDECCKRAGLLDTGRKPLEGIVELGGHEPVQGSKSLTTKHDAMGDAEIVIRLLAKAWGIPV